MDSGAESIAHTTMLTAQGGSRNRCHSYLGRSLLRQTRATRMTEVRILTLGGQVSTNGSLTFRLPDLEAITLKDDILKGKISWLDINNILIPVPNAIQSIEFVQL